LFSKQLKNALVPAGDRLSAALICKGRKDNLPQQLALSRAWRTAASAVFFYILGDAPS
jgi:hypothetical protein